MGLRLAFFIGIMAVGLTGCYVNRASIEPFAYAPYSPCLYWSPDERAAALADQEVSDCVDLPPEECELSLAEVLDIALVNNPQTELSWAKARESAAEYGLSQATAFPQIDAEFQCDFQRTAYLASQVEQQAMGQSVIASNQYVWGPRAQISWILLDFGQRRYTSEAARYALYYADYTHNQTLQMLVEDITIEYYKCLYEKKLLEANEADLADAEETLAAAELGLKTGVKNISDVLQARTQALLAEIQLSQQNRSVNTAYATLLERMGLPANAIIKLQKLPIIDPEKVELCSVDDYIDTAFQCRPDLLAARASVTSSEMSLKAAKRAWTPVLDYSLDIGRTYFNTERDNYDFNSILTVKMPIFTGFKIRNTIKKSEAIVEEAEATLKQIELDVIKDVTTAHFNIGVAYETLKSAIKFLESAKEQYQVALAQYKQGVNTILDVVSAQTALFDARATQARAIQQWFVSLATLTYSAGIISTNIGCD